jgi:hypothetical protein
LRRWRSYPRFTATNQPPKEHSPSSTKTRPMIPRLPAWIRAEEVVTRWERLGPPVAGFGGYAPFAAFPLQARLRYSPHCLFF